jgi:hypothetical protein
MLQQVRLSSGQGRILQNRRRFGKAQMVSRPSFRRQHGCQPLSFHGERLLDFGQVG